VVEDGVEDDSKPSPVTSTALIGLNRGQEVVEEVATPESGQMVSTTNHRGKATLTCTVIRWGKMDLVAVKKIQARLR
jgi:hypothetical protein